VASLCRALPASDVHPGVRAGAGSERKAAHVLDVSNWSIPRAQWAEMEKANASDQKILDKAMSDVETTVGTIAASVSVPVKRL